MSDQQELDVLSHLRNQLQILRQLETRVNEHLHTKLSSIEEDIEELTDRVKETKTLVEKISENQVLVIKNQDTVLTGIATIIKTLGTPQAIPVMQIQFKGDSTMGPGKVSKGQTIDASGIETDAFGKSVTIDPANATWSIDDAAIASFVQNADGSATFTPLAAGDTIVRLTDNSTGAVGTNTLSVSGGPDVLTLTFGDPQAATPA